MVSFADLTGIKSILWGRCWTFAAVLSVLLGNGICQQCSQGEKEFLYLVQQWPQGYCLTSDCASSVTVPTQSFTIHGLWPNYCTTGYPSDCPSESYSEQKISDLLPRMRISWPTFSSTPNSYFWSHEWSKHGSCVVADKVFPITTQKGYFQTALNFQNATNLYGNLVAQGIRPRRQSYTKSVVVAALQKTLGVQPYLNCATGSNSQVIQEIWLCYNSKLNLVNCSNAGDCPANVILYSQGS